MSLCSAGDHVLVSRSVFGSTISLFEKYFKRFGIEVDYVPLADLSGWDAAIKANTKLLFVESPSNPLAELVDIAALSEVAHAKGATSWWLSTTPTAPRTCNARWSWAPTWWCIQPPST